MTYENKNKILSIFILVIIILALIVLFLEIKQDIDNTKIRKKNQQELIYNKDIVDKYQWLKDENWPEVNNFKVLEH